MNRQARVEVRVADPRLGQPHQSDAAQQNGTALIWYPMSAACQHCRRGPRRASPNAGRQRAWETQMLPGRRRDHALLVLTLRLHPSR